MEQVAERVAVEQSKAPVFGGMKAVGQGEVTPLGRSQIALVMEGLALQKTINDATKALEEIDARLLDAHGVGCTLAVADLTTLDYRPATVDLTEETTVTIIDVDKLIELLGRRFLDLVEESVAYTATPALVALACDGNHPLRAEIGACLSVQTRQRVGWNLSPDQA
jgi:hypothetical protein